jgi:hypothetical protein
VPVLDIHEIVDGKMVALVTRRAARDLFDAQRIIAMPSLDWAKIKAATLMIGASAKSFDWRTCSCHCSVVDDDQVGNPLAPEAEVEAQNQRVR